MFEEEKEKSKDFETKLNRALDILNLIPLQAKLSELREKQNIPEIYSDFNQLKKINQEISKIEKTINPWIDLQNQFEELKLLIEIAEEEEEEKYHQEIDQVFSKMEDRFDQQEVILLFQDPFDQSNTFLTIHSGAGGTESCDWVSMLLRMYQRWVDQKDFNYRVVDYQAGEEAGIKSVSILVVGNYAHGLLKGENGVHRLVRISPFDSNKRRHTSFASVSVTAEIDDEIEIEINPADLRIDTFRASGAGGQHVNTTDSAVRITHQPSGIVVNCQAERSQHQNKEAAMKMLRSKLYEVQLQKQTDEINAEKGEKKKIEWGSQIRSYVFHPYNLVKDHRTNLQTSNVQAVMDGEIDLFLNNFLRNVIVN